MGLIVNKSRPLGGKPARYHTRFPGHNFVIAGGFDAAVHGLAPGLQVAAQVIGAGETGPFFEVHHVIAMFQGVLGCGLGAVDQCHYFLPGHPGDVDFLFHCSLHK